MKGKLVALAVVLMVFAIFEYVFFPRSAPGPQAQSLDPPLLPSAIGSFRSTSRWRQTINSHLFEVGASYRDGSGIEAELDVLLGAWAPDNGLDCWYVRGYPAYWRRLRAARTARGSVFFDTALFDDAQGLLLIASTQCYPTGCRASLPPIFFLPGFGLRMLTSIEPAAAPRPISIVVRELNDAAGSRQAQGERLVQGFERFAAQLDLSPLLVMAIAPSAR